jgi:hypothetical protein
VRQNHRPLDDVLEFAEVPRPGMGLPGVHHGLRDGFKFDDTTKKKAGRHIEGLARYRNGAGSARQEYRTLRGLNFVLGVMRVPLRQWPGRTVTVPIGLELSRNAEHAPQRGLPSRSRSALARSMLDFVATQRPGRQLRALGDGGYATKEFLRALPPTVHVRSRLLNTGKLYALSAPLTGRRRGRPPRKGSLRGSPKALQQTPQGWGAHPTEAGAEVQTWVGLWHTVLPGRLVRVVVSRRRPATPAKPSGQRKPLPSGEACCTTDLSLSGQAILEQYRARWAIASTMRDSNTFGDLGQHQGRQLRRSVGANTFRLALAAPALGADAGEGDRVRAGHLWHLSSRRVLAVGRWQAPSWPARNWQPPAGLGQV